MCGWRQQWSSFCFDCPWNFSDNVKDPAARHKLTTNHFMVGGGCVFMSGCKSTSTVVVKSQICLLYSCSVFAPDSLASVLTRFQPLALNLSSSLLTFHPLPLASQHLAFGMVIEGKSSPIGIECLAGFTYLCRGIWKDYIPTSTPKLFFYSKVMEWLLYSAP
jgi:hypothetical protein